VTASIAGSGYPASSGFTISFIVLAVISLGAAAVAARVPGNHGRAREGRRRLLAGR
jgi:hypothetical protein